MNGSSRKRNVWVERLGLVDVLFLFLKSFFLPLRFIMTRGV